MKIMRKKVRKIAIISFYALIFCVYTACSTKNTNEPPGRFTFNYFNSYDNINIKLSDLAKVHFIQLGANDSILIGKTQSEYSGVQLTSDYIYVKENNSIFIFDKMGTPINTIMKQGQGPEEWNDLNRFAVDTLSNEIFVLDYAGKIIVYDLIGNYKRSFSAFHATEFLPLNDSTLICYCPYPKINKGEPVFYLDKITGNKKGKSSITFSKYIFDEEGRIGYSALVKGYNGVFISDFSLKNIYFIDINYQETSLIKDDSDYETDFVKIHPVIDTIKFTLFQLLFSHWISPNLHNNYYLYDKNKNKLYLIGRSENGFSDCLNNFCYIDKSMNTVNSNIAINKKMPYGLIELKEKNKIKNDVLRNMINRMKDDDNPLLQIMVFNNSEIEPDYLK